MKKYLPFISLWLTNSVLIYLAPLAMPQYYELGTHLIMPLPGAVFSGLLVTALCWIMRPSLEDLVKKTGVKLKGRRNLFLFYWGANFIAVWLVARFATYTGLGITTFYWALILALILNIGQWGMWQILKKDKLV